MTGSPATPRFCQLVMTCSKRKGRKIAICAGRMRVIVCVAPSVSLTHNPGKKKRPIHGSVACSSCPEAAKRPHQSNAIFSPLEMARCQPFDRAQTRDSEVGERFDYACRPRNPRQGRWKFSTPTGLSHALECRATKCGCFNNLGFRRSTAHVGKT